MSAYISEWWNRVKTAAFFPGKPEWTTQEIPDLTGKVAIVTGGNSGIGKETCVELAKKGAKVYMGARNKERALPALEEIKNRAGDDAKVEWLELDLEDLGSVKRAAEKVKKGEKELHLYYQNAGVMATPFTKTKSGFEMQWGTNVVGHFALTQHLLPLLISTAKSSKEGEVRVIHTSSAAHLQAPQGGIVFEDTDLPNHNTWVRYGQSKLANILMSKELARRHSADGIYSLSVHPGVIMTELGRGPAASYGEWLVKPSYFLLGWLMLNPQQGALTQLYAGTSKQVVEKKQNGAFFIPFAREFEPSSYAKDADLATKLWKHLEKQTAGKL
eukprot:TRINITY_DN8650_c0_g1_i1.p1 TRINITY_DN8650_c0_g1~~TRINITY_DN8650_c0_g1_i1.p1  ORF type:complete len:329 (-),score=103.92 TRINITY_DN8650_c0_g1_i1:84-1070(-)